MSLPKNVKKNVSHLPDITYRSRRLPPVSHSTDKNTKNNVEQSITDTDGDTDGDRSLYIFYLLFPPPLICRPRHAQKNTMTTVMLSVLRKQNKGVRQREGDIKKM